MYGNYMRLLVYTGKTPLYNASVKGDIHLHMTVYMWGLRGRYFLTKDSFTTPLKYAKIRGTVSMSNFRVSFLSRFENLDPQSYHGPRRFSGWKIVLADKSVSPVSQRVKITKQSGPPFRNSLNVLSFNNNGSLFTFVKHHGSPCQ